MIEPGVVVLFAVTFFSLFVVFVNLRRGQERRSQQRRREAPMYPTGPTGTDWPKALIVIAAIGAVAAVIIWLRVDFGSGYALAGLLAAAVTAALIAGMKLTQGNTEHVLARVAQFMDSMVDGEIARQKATAGLHLVERERAKAEAAERAAAARLIEVEARKRIELETAAARGQLQIEQRAAGAVAAYDARRQRQQEQQQAAVYRPSWQQAAPDRPDFPEV